MQAVVSNSASSSKQQPVLVAPTKKKPKRPKVRGLATVSIVGSSCACF